MKEKKKFLILTNNEDLKEALKLILEGEYSVTSLSKKQIEKIDSGGFNSVFVDFIDGRTGEIAELSVAMKRINKPIIAILDFRNLETRREVMNEGIYDFIEFPIDPDRVKITVQRAVNYELLKSLEEQHKTPKARRIK
jgi:DNA-binding NtrC family response regulator